MQSLSKRGSSPQPTLTQLCETHGVDGRLKRAVQRTTYAEPAVDCLYAHLGVSTVPQRSPVFIEAVEEALLARDHIDAQQHEQRERVFVVTLIAAAARRLATNTWSAKRGPNGVVWEPWREPFSAFVAESQTVEHFETAPASVSGVPMTTLEAMLALRVLDAALVTDFYSVEPNQSAII
jgi:hypothetical protein